MSSNMKSLSVFIAMLVVAGSFAEAKFLRRSRYFDDQLEGATGERAILTVRGTRNPYDGSAPSKIAIEDNPYRGPFPRGVYDRLDSAGGYNRRPLYPMDDYNNGPGLGLGGGYGGYPGGYNGGYNSGYDRYNYGPLKSSTQRRYDFLDPDFGVKTSLKLGSNRKSRCRINSEADSEIPALGLDSGRLNIDCDVNPVRMAQAAARVAHKYRQRRRNPQHSKQTQININYKKSHHNSNQDDSDDNDDD